MGGSSGGSIGDAGMSNQERRAIRSSYSNLGSIGGQLRDIAGSADVKALAGQGLTPAEQMQLGLIDMGRAGMEQTVRDATTSRGLFSSTGAIAQEGLIPMQLAQQKADIYGQAQNRQFQGLGLQQGLLGSAGQMYSGMGGLAQGLGSSQITADAYNQEASLNRYKINQASQQQTMGGISAGVGMAAQLAPYILPMLSDARLKKNVQPITNAVETIKKLNGKTFEWVSNGQADAGVIAQELEEVLPDLVDNSGEFKKVNYIALIGYLIEAVKELSNGR